MRQLNQLRASTAAWTEMGRHAADLIELLELAEAEDDDATRQEVSGEAERLTARLDEMEFQLALGGEYDANDALISIHASEGGTESQDWAEMLLRMYLRWAEKSGRKSEILDLTHGEEAGIKSATIQVQGDYAYG